MNLEMKTALFFFLFLFIINTSSQTHPYLLVKQQDFEILQERSNLVPWSIIKERAFEALDEIEYSKNVWRIKKYNLCSDLADALALCYILDQGSRNSYVERFEDEVSKLINDIREIKEFSDMPDEHGYNVGPAQAAFHTYLALDIMYNDISQDIKKEIEDDLKYISTHHVDNWQESKYAIEGMYALYTFGPKSEKFIQKKNQYKKYLLSAASKDGVYTTGPGYVHSRLYMDRRTQKKIFMDICELQGYHDFYSDSTFINLYEWMFGYTVTPFNVTYTFGDSPPVKPINDWATSALRVNRFSKEAQAYASWFLGPIRELSFKNTLLDYALVDGLPVKPNQPESRIFRNGGAWLYGDDPTADNLAGVLWNINTEEESHSHLDANSINLVGYGDFLIRNSGYDNWQSPDPKTWEWLHHDARSSNTITINERNHNSYRGDGITKSVIGYDLEFATGFVSKSIPEGEHTRTLVSIKNEVNYPGYFILFDEVKSDKPEQEIDFYLHPNSSGKPNIDEDENVYRFSIKQCYNLVDKLFINIVYNDKPNTTDLKDGYFGSYEDCTRFMSKYLDAKFQTDTKGEKDYATIFIPERNDEIIPEMEQIHSAEYNITKLTSQNDVSDYIINPTENKEVNIESYNLKAVFAYLRKEKDDVKNVLAYKAAGFFANNESIGFESDYPIDFLLNYDKGEIISKDCKVKIFYPEITKFYLDSELIFNSTETIDSIEFNLTSGNHKFKIISEQRPERNDGEKINYFLANAYQFYLSPYTKITFGIPVKEKVKILLFDSEDKLVETLLNEEQEAGVHSIFFNSNEKESGEYFYKMITPNKEISKKLIIVKDGEGYE